jgi:hypothetical protein
MRSRSIGCLLGALVEVSMKMDWTSVSGFIHGRYDRLGGDGAVFQDLRALLHPLSGADREYLDGYLAGRGWSRPSTTPPHTSRRDGHADALLEAS